jgi:hypothetical protein
VKDAHKTWLPVSGVLETGTAERSVECVVLDFSDFLDASARRLDTSVERFPR